MDKHDSEGDTDHGERLIKVRSSVIAHQLAGDPISCDGFLKDLLEVAGVIVVEQASANEETGIVIKEEKSE